MWQTTRALPHRTSLIVGCGSNHDHPGLHLQADTIDIDRSMNPDIVGSILDPSIGQRFFRKYKFILCEGLDLPLYNDLQLYVNLDFLRAENFTIVLTGIPVYLFDKVRGNCFAVDLNARKITSFDEFPPHLYIDPHFEQVTRWKIANSPNPAVIIDRCL